MAIPPKGTPEYDAWYQKVSKGHFKKGQEAWNKGIPQSEEQLKKLSAKRKGRTPWNKGHRKVSEPKQRKKRIVSEATRLKISLSEQGKRVSDETRVRLSNANPWKGKSIPQFETANYAFTEGYSTVISARNRQRWQNMTEDERRVHLDKLHRDIIVSRLEEIIAAELDAQGIVYERQKHIGWYRVDFYIPSENRIIEAQGCYWHGCEQCGYNKEHHQEKRAKDTKRYEYLQRKGYILEIIWEHDRQNELRLLRKDK